ncbi:unnamed protein product [Orchesella dallaii]|uniref:Uncharacterized protein n=1 Tax=Orchesella dallaii TaxID=48710 RepID=A0ABP1RPL4_9HEXA
MQQHIWEQAILKIQKIKDDFENVVVVAELLVSIANLLGSSPVAQAKKSTKSLLQAGKKKCTKFSSTMSVLMQLPCLFSNVAAILALILPDRFECMTDAESMENVEPRSFFMALLFAVMCTTIIIALVEVYSVKMKKDEKVPKPSDDIIEI